MTQELAPEVRNVTLEVKGVGAQTPTGDWKITAVDLLGTNGLGMHPMTLFVSSEVAPQAGASYDATLVKGKPKPGKEGTALWDWYWNPISWGSHTAPDSPVTAPQQPVQAPQQAQGVPVPAAPDGGWNPGNDIDRREALKEVSFHKQKALEQATIALGTTTESALMIADYIEQRAWLYRDALALLREPLPKVADEEVIDGE